MSDWISVEKLPKPPKPFGFMRNIDFWFISILIGHDLIWVRVYPFIYGLEIIANGWKSTIKIRRASK